ncbi:hypothetical protein ACHQM5_016188 [Ranunculus cassubicifolius]
MAKSGTFTAGVDNTFRRKFDREEYLERARQRELDEQQQKRPHPLLPRVPLKHRDYEVDFESRLGKTHVVSSLGPLCQQAGFFCQVCDCIVKDSLNYLDHINGKKHQRKLGMSMRVERASVTQVKERFFEKRRTAETFTEEDYDECILKLQEEEDERKRQRREKMKEKKKEKAMEEEAVVEEDLNVAEMMGFGGFRTSKK